MIMQLTKTRTRVKPYEVVSPITHQAWPIVVLVGRKNVGKSSLFNRLTQTREALVADFPGLTRDRLYGQARVGTRPYLVIDTGGLLGDTGQSPTLENLVTEQVDAALQEATHIVMLVDGRVGLTIEDQTIADKLRTFNKPIFLTVNKTEALALEIATHDFFQLGLGLPCPISAEHGQGITDLIEHIFSDTPIAPPAIELSPLENTAGIKITVAGCPNAGKSTLINHMLGEARHIVSAQSGTTRDSSAIKLQYRGNEYTLIDTAGIRRQSKIVSRVEWLSVVKSLQAIHASHVVILMIDAQLGVTEQDLRLLQFILEAGRALVIAINKWDGLSSEHRRQVQDMIDRRLHFVPFVKKCFISALHGTGIGDLFKPIQQAYKSAMHVPSAASLTRLLQEAVTAHAPPSVKGRTIKLRYAHPGGRNPPIIKIHGRHSQSLPEAYKRYLEGFYRRALRSVGTPIRIEFIQ